MPNSPDAIAQQDRFIAVLAHELRNPIAPLRSGLELLATDRLDPPARRATVATMQRHLVNLVRLLDDLLSAARLRGVTMPVAHHRSSLRDVLRSATETVEASVRGKHQRLVVENEAADARVDVDPTRMSQALSNLLDASVNESPDGGLISMNARVLNDSVLVSIEDEAAGRAPGRTDAGLGLVATVATLAALDHATVEVHSRRPALGRVFEIRMPLAAPAEAASVDRAAHPAEAESVPGALKPQRVLVVDDNADAARMLGMLFELDGHTVCFAHDGETAVREAHDFMPGIVLMDIGMPGPCDGLAAIRRIRAARLAVRPFIVALTGWGAPEDRHATAAAGSDLHLVKPIDFEQLKASVSAGVQALA